MQNGREAHGRSATKHGKSIKSVPVERLQRPTRANKLHALPCSSSVNWTVSSALERELYGTLQKLGVLGTCGGCHDYTRSNRYDEGGKIPMHYDTVVKQSKRFPSRAGNTVKSALWHSVPISVSLFGGSRVPRCCCNGSPATVQPSYSQGQDFSAVAQVRGRSAAQR